MGRKRAAKEGDFLALSPLPPPRWAPAAPLRPTAALFCPALQVVRAKERLDDELRILTQQEPEAERKPDT